MILENTILEFAKSGRLAEVRLRTGTRLFLFFLPAPTFESTLIDVVLFDKQRFRHNKFQIRYTDIEMILAAPRELAEMDVPSIEITSKISLYFVRNLAIALANELINRAWHEFAPAIEISKLNSDEFRGNQLLAMASQAWERKNDDVMKSIGVIAAVFSREEFEFESNLVAIDFEKNNKTILITPHKRVFPNGFYPLWQNSEILPLDTSPANLWAVTAEVSCLCIGERSELG